MQVKTNKGYTGEVVGQSLDCKDYHVVLEGCSTYDINHPFDVVPKDDCEEVVEPKRWRTEIGDRYYSISERLRVARRIESDHWSDDNHYEAGNYFISKVSAQAAAEAIKTVLTWMHDPEADTPLKAYEMHKKLNAARDAVQEG